jgi:hypothetical protein
MGLVAILFILTACNEKDLERPDIDFVASTRNLEDRSIPAARRYRQHVIINEARQTHERKKW